MLNGKAIITYSLAGLIKMVLYKMSQYFPKPYEPFEEALMLILIYLIMQQKQT